MTTSLATPPGTLRLPVMDGVRRVHAVLDTVDAGAVGPVNGRDVAEVERAISRLESLKLTMVAAADQQDAGPSAGMSGTSAWLAAHTRSWGGKAAADVLLATALEESLPMTKEALAAGAVSTSHAAVIAHTTSRLPESLTEEERAKVESALVREAKHVDPARLRRAARRALLAAERTAAEVDAHEDAELRSEEARAEARVRLTMHDNRDGTITGHFTVPTLAGSVLRKTIQQMASPRRGGPGGRADRGAVREAPGRAGGPGRDVVREVCAGAADSVGNRSGGGVTLAGARGDDWAHRHGQAFVELLEHLDTDRLNGKVAATVVVTIDHERLRQNLGAAHLDTGHDLSASEARRLACSAGLLPAVLRGSSLPLDLGRSNRFFSEAQRVALATTYDECSAEGCDRPYAWCELHHEDPWAAGGATDLHLAVPLCRFHHRRVHDPGYAHRVRADRHGRKGVVLRRRT